MKNEYNVRIELCNYMKIKRKTEQLNSYLMKTSEWSCVYDKQ